MWTDIHVPKVSRIEGIAEVFEVTSVGNLPLVKFKLYTGPKSVQVVMLSLVFAIVSLKKNHPVGWLSRPF